MAITHPAVSKWFASQYPNFAFHPEWLDGCIQFLQSQGNYSNPELIKRVLHELISDDLGKTVSPSPTHAASANKLLPPPSSTTCILNSKLLLQINEITEIGHSALSLLEVANERSDEAAQMRLSGEENLAVGAVTKRFPRQMLKFRLTDGLKEVSAIEYERIKELELGDIDIGAKLVVHGAKYKNGIILLTPKTTRVLGGGIKEWDSDGLLREILESRLEEARRTPVVDENAGEEKRRKKRIVKNKANVKAAGTTSAVTKEIRPPNKGQKNTRKNSDITGWMEENVIDDTPSQSKNNKQEDFDMEDWDEDALEEVEMILSTQVIGNKLSSSGSNSKSKNVIFLDSD